MPLDLDKVKEYLDSPEGQRTLERLVREEEAKRKELLDFYGSDIFEGMLAEFDNSEESYIDCDIYYKPVGYMSYEKFVKLFYSIWNTHSKEITEVEDACFPTETLKFRNYELTLTHGQGSVARITKVK